MASTLTKILERQIGEGLSSLWTSEFGPYKWFFMADADVVMFNAGMNVSEIMKDEYTILQIGYKINKILEEKWTNFGSFSHMQLTSAKQGNLMRLDKSILVRATLDMLAGNIKYEEITKEYIEYIFMSGKILPSTFVIEGINRYISSDSVFKSVSHRSHQKQSVLKHVMDGHPVVKPVAELVLYAINQISINDLRISLLKHRKGKNGRLIAPCFDQSFRTEYGWTNIW